MIGDEAGVSSGAVFSSEKTLFDVLRDIWRARYAMVFSAAVAAVFAILFVRSAVPFHRAEMVIAPASPIGGQSRFQLPVMPDFRLWESQSLQNYPDFMRFENKFNASSVAGLLLEDARVEEGLFGDRAFIFLDGESDWTPEALSRYLQRRVKLEPVGNTPLRKLVYMHPDRAFAMYMLGRIHHITDTLIRQNIRLETQERIEYLQDALTRTANPDHRRALADLLMEQERLRMMVSMDQPYAASIVEPPSAGLRADWPDLLLIFPAFILVGCLAGFLFYGARHIHE